MQDKDCWSMLKSGKMTSKTLSWWNTLRTCRQIFSLLGIWQVLAKSQHWAPQVPSFLVLRLGRSALCNSLHQPVGRIWARTHRTDSPQRLWLEYMKIRSAKTPSSATRFKNLGCTIFIWHSAQMLFTEWSNETCRMQHVPSRVQCLAIM